MKLYEQLSIAKVEKDVENIYRNVLLNDWFRGSEITSPYGTDGELINKKFNLKILLEFKYNINFFKRMNVVKILIQCLYYLKKYKNDGQILPNIIFVGNKKQFFYIHCNILDPYLNLEEVDWTLAPSIAGNPNTKLFNMIKIDNHTNPYIYEVDNKLIEKNIKNEIINLSSNISIKIKITSKNISSICCFFINNVIKQKKKYNVNEKINIFLSTILNPEENYLHPVKKNKLQTKDYNEVLINGNIFNGLIQHFDRQYTQTEKRKIISICDILIEDETRRVKGEYYTPSSLVTIIHQLIESEFGEDWKEKYVVWDPSCGTGNLTRDYSFKELYCSTLNNSDIGIINQAGYNQGAVKFQFDLLNNSFNNLPKKLLKSLSEKKPIIIIMNPPIGTAGNLTTDGTHKGGIAKTKINDVMINDKMGKCSGQLYAQFLYILTKLKEIYNIENFNICTFAPPLFLTGPSFIKFRQYFMSNFKFSNGIMFNAGEFAGVSDSWPISFTIWKYGITNNKNKFNLLIKSINKIGEKNDEFNEFNKYVYNLDNNSLSNWGRIEVKKMKSKKLINYEDVPQLSSPLNIKQSGHGNFIKNALGYLNCQANNVRYNINGTGLYTSAFSVGSGFSVIESNFNKAIALYTARRTIQPNWITWYDEYMIPNIHHSDYEQWNIDCIVYSIFYSNQSSLRNINYKGEIYDIQNEWFWMSNNEIKELADKYNYTELFNDTIKYSNNRFIYNKLQEVNLSNDAQELLDVATSLVIESFKYRNDFDNDYPEYHLNAWDAGWYQLNLIFQEYYPIILKKFKNNYKKFEDRMREGVYKFGFLKR